MNSEKRKYCSQVRRYLPCSRRMKQNILSQLGDRLDTWLEDHPEAGYDQLEARFGTPRQIAAVYIENASAEELMGTLNIRNRILRMVAVTLLVIVMLWAGVVAFAAIDAYQSSHRYVITSTQVIYHSGE